ncbi:MAG: S-layer homology domain-containing protein [Oscillospiraceae bacterium]|nr:S-layer homology domain-containing protein [Oscillospiraceae bacterium]
MRKKLKRIASLLFVLCLLLPIGAAAVENGGWQLDEITHSRDIATDNEWETLILINTLRLNAGREPLAMTRDLQSAASIRAYELDTSFGSTRPNDTPWYTVLDEAGIVYNGAAELTARNFLFGSAAVAEWANGGAALDILLGNFTHIGIGHDFGGDTWSVLFLSAAAHTELSLHPSGARHITAGESLFSLGLMVQADGPAGISFLPLMDGMARGLDQTQAGLQTVTIGLGGLFTTFYLEVRFTDVPGNSWYFPYVRFVTHHELFQGISPSEFDPESPMTRAMFVTVLGRLATQMGLEITGDHSPFSDVQAGMWYTRYIGWAADRGIAQGFDGRFGVNDPVTREQMATFLLRFVHYIELELTSARTPFIADRAQINAWARESVDLFVGLGLIDLDERAGTFNPSDPATRAVVAKALTILARDHIQ